MKEKLLKYENNKLKQQLIFNLPVSKQICGRECPGCYALKSQVRFPTTVLPYRERRYQASLQDNFISTITKEITSCKKSLLAVRIHESGEFYSQQYLDKWTSIATQLPNITFYAFTKRMKDFDFSKLMALPNVSIIDSLMHGGLNYAPRAQLKPGVTICPATIDTSIKCGLDCSYCMSKLAQQQGVCFVKH